MRIEDLICYLQVANDLSITKAAENLHLTQQALSAKMKALEHYYGLSLFETLPSRRGIVLTYAGELLRQSAAQIVALNRRVKNLGQENQADNTIVGDLRFGATNNRTRYFLQEVLAEFHGTYPNVSIRARAGVMHQVERLLLDGAIDLAFGLDAFQSDRIAFTHLADERLLAVIPKSFLPKYWGISPEDENTVAALCQGVMVKQLRGLPLVLFDRGNYLRKLVDDLFQKNEMPAAPIMELNDIDAMLRLANSGVGITFCRELVAAFNDLFYQERCQLLTVPVLDAPAAQFILGYRSNYMIPNFVEHFIFLVQQKIQRYQENRNIP